MPFVPQNFVNGGGPAISAVWLNGLDVTCNFVLNGATTVAQALTALGITGFSSPLQIAQGGTGQTTAANALTALGGITPAAAFAADATNLTTAENFATSAANTAQTNAENFTSASYAPLASPTFTGVPAAPTVSAPTNTTQLATLAAIFGNMATGSSSSSQGYVKIPTSGGTAIIIQFGASASAGTSITYPIAFTTLACPIVYGQTVETTNLTAVSLTGFTYTTGGGVGVYWHALGY